MPASPGPTQKDQCPTCGETRPLLSIKSAADLVDVDRKGARPSRIGCFHAQAVEEVARNGHCLPLRFLKKRMPTVPIWAEQFRFSQSHHADTVSSARLGPSVIVASVLRKRWSNGFVRTKNR